jgi:hypothetical protein
VEYEVEGCCLQVHGLSTGRVSTSMPCRKKQNQVPRLLAAIKAAVGTPYTVRTDHNEISEALVKYVFQASILEGK